MRVELIAELIDVFSSYKNDIVTRICNIAWNIFYRSLLFPAQENILIHADLFFLIHIN